MYFVCICDEIVTPLVWVLTLKRKKYKFWDGNLHPICFCCGLLGCLTCLPSTEEAHGRSSRTQDRAPEAHSQGEPWSALCWIFVVVGPATNVWLWWPLYLEAEHLLMRNLTDLITESNLNHAVAGCLSVLSKRIKCVNTGSIFAKNILYDQSFGALD